MNFCKVIRFCCKILDYLILLIYSYLLTLRILIESIVGQLIHFRSHHFPSVKSIEENAIYILADMLKSSVSFLNQSCSIENIQMENSEYIKKYYDHGLFSFSHVVLEGDTKLCELWINLISRSLSIMPRLESPSAPTTALVSPSASVAKAFEYDKVLLCLTRHILIEYDKIYLPYSMYARPIMRSRLLHYSRPLCESKE